VLFSVKVPPFRANRGILGKWQSGLLFRVPGQPPPPKFLRDSREQKALTLKLSAKADLRTLFCVAANPNGPGLNQQAGF
jgi:hypothetical protein